MTLSAYDLQSALNKKFTVSFESEQEIEIQAEEVVINSDASVDGEIEELNEDIEAADEASDNIEEVDEAVTTLESLIYSMESSVLTGGFDKRNAALANISLESITTKFDLETTLLSFGMEEVEDDGEAETKSTIGKAKQMLSALKSNSGALLNKMYASAASALGNTAALSAKLLAKATAIKNNINADNKGGDAVKLSRGVKRKLTVDGKTVLSADQYVKELKRLTDKYNTVVKTYADTAVLDTFVSDALSQASGKQGEPKSKKAIIASVRSISEGITKSGNAKGDTETATSEPYLGGAVLTLKRPTKSSVMSLLDDVVKQTENTETVSQEGLGRAIGGLLQIPIGALVFGAGILGSMAAGTSLVGATTFSGVVGVILVMAVSMWGIKKGIEWVASGVYKNADELIKLVKGVRNKFSKQAEEAVVLSTEFEVETTGASMEADEDATVTSLSAKQIAQVADIILATGTTTQTMRAETNKRKSTIKNVNNLTKALNKEEGANTGVTKASATFIKHFIKQTAKFEMQLTSYTVQVMKAALAYAEASNSATPAEEPAAE